MSELIAFFVGLWDKLIAWIVYGIETVKVFLQSLVLTLWDAFQDFFAWIFDQLLSIASSALSLVDFDASQFNACSVPLAGEVLNILGLVGIGEAAAIIVSAIGIRIILQLIPFTRLGS
ncbi:MAG: DUF2523 family protein [Bacteroidota bacterium]